MNLFQLKREHLKDIVRTTTDSFLTDPYFNFMFYELNEAEKHEFIANMEEAFVDQVVDFNECYALDESLSSVALILPPIVGYPEEKWDKFTDRQSELLKEKGYDITFERILKLEDFISIKFEEYDAINSYYLITLSTDKNYRNQGLASKLLKELFKKFDREERKCYIECTNDINIQFYKKHDFIILGSFKLPSVGDVPSDEIPTITFMERIPKPIN
ncbi:hypothetical protein DICPUDRAFT_148349 [Dictyostelium purpureum]|uniref:N-acetyltransferase domain-containing protein n=1 Tax=Dictyostelium purpureum TaxID=5786 RepID=F0ZAW5_DICPU|nr:uncharacterized protein DICPUDRAFT_148349 [Dictyostelium purpureum]EGC38898.1 hypothetical protein DICPUDRAFT_148349 [Dictyostelium purpureum]|eukprot:XP_003284578.1 hypothetical protein DICPUDRAFT_148349 [Dictyostelium purpureum]